MERPRLLIILLAAVMFVGSAPAYLSQIADYGAAQLARQAVDIQAPYLAQMARITYLQKSGKQKSGAGPSRKAAATHRAVNTTFTRSEIGWYKPWAMANELAQQVKWDEHAPFGSGFAREEAQRQALTKLFTECLEVYERRSKAEGIPTNDLAITFSHCIALNTELGSGRKMSAKEESALREKLRDQFARSDDYWTDSDKQSIHETIVIMTMLAQAGYANVKRNQDQRDEETFREVGRRNVEALTSASLRELRNARSVLGSR
jgi:Family of unknown function (DUF6683)